MQHFSAIFLSVLVMFAGTSQLHAASKKVYIRTFAAGEGITSPDQASDIKDYMAEVFTKSLSLITDEFSVLAVTERF